MLRKTYTSLSAKSFPLNARRLSVARELANNLHTVCCDDSKLGVNCQRDLCLQLPFDLDRILDSRDWRDILALELISRGSSFIGKLNRDFSSYYGDPFRESSIWKAGYQVFLSYEASNYDLAQSLALELEKYRFAVFLAPKNIMPFSRWKSALLDALHESDAFLALHSYEYMNSSWCQQEVGIAVGAEIPIVHLSVNAAPIGFDSETQALALIGENLPDVAFRIFEHLMEIPGQVEMYANCGGLGYLVDCFCVARDRIEMKTYASILYKLPPQEIVDDLDRTKSMLVFLKEKQGYVSYLRDVILKLRDMGANIPWHDFGEPSDFSGFIRRVMEPSGFEGKGLWRLL